MSPRDRGRVVAVELDSDDASQVAQVLFQIGALIDPDDPDGLRDAFGVLQPELVALKLTEDQFRMLDPHISYSDDERASVARRRRLLTRERFRPWRGLLLAKPLASRDLERRNPRPVSL